MRVFTASHRNHPAFPHAMVYDLYRALGDRLVDTVIGVKPADLKPAPRFSGPHDSAVRMASPVKRVAASTHSRPARNSANRMERIW
jgi:hypothetical protein